MSRAAKFFGFSLQRDRLSAVSRVLPDAARPIIVCTATWYTAAGAEMTKMVCINYEANFLS
jgi:hypothetical protein